MEMTDEALRVILRAELAPIKDQLTEVKQELEAIRPLVDGIPLMNRKLTAVEQQGRMLKAAFNDFALTNPTSGEIQALHEDVNRVQAEYTELATRLITVERLIRELQEKTNGR